MGSIADWLLLIVTGITAYYLYQTLTSQRKVQEDQQKITKIENERFVREQDIRFGFTIDQQKLYQNSQEDEYVNFILDMSLHILNADCKNFRLDVTAEKSTLHFRNNPPYTEDRVYQNSEFKIHFRVQLPREIYNDDEEETIDLNLSFEDNISNKYIQNCKVKLLRGMVNISSTSPELLS